MTAYREKDLPRELIQAKVACGGSFFLCGAITLAVVYAAFGNLDLPVLTRNLLVVGGLLALGQSVWMLMVLVKYVAAIENRIEAENI